MPFTFAHPAAVLPFNRWRWLHVLPLVIGSMVPDLLRYFPFRWVFHRPVNTHSFKASITIDLLAGMLLLWMILALCNALTEPVWQPHRQLIRNTVADFAALPKRIWIGVLSMQLGIWTHLLWDAFTHEDSLIVNRFALLQRPLFPAATHELPLYHALQYGCSVLGLVVVAWWYWRSLRTVQVDAAEVQAHAWRKWMVLALLIPCGVAALLVLAMFTRRAPSLYWALGDAIRVAILLFGCSYLVLVAALSVYRWWQSRHAV